MSEVAAIDPGVLSAISRQRAAALLDRHRKGRRLTLEERDELRAALPGIIPDEAPAAAPSAAPVISASQRADRFYARRIHQPRINPQRAKSRKWLTALFAQVFLIRERKPSLQWVMENIVIPSSVSPTHPGAFNPDLFPLANIVYQWFDDPKWREIVIVKSSQAGISQAFQNLTCYIADHQLGDIMWLFESATKAKQINNERIKVMITEACKCLGEYISDDEDDLQNMILKLKGMKIVMAGAMSASQNASRTMPHVFCDEGDEYPTELQGGESHAWTLIRERAKLIETGTAKLALFSKPRTDIKPGVEDTRLRNRKKKDDGIVWKEYLAGTRHKCFIPCIHCAVPFEITQDLIKFGHCRRADGVSWDFDRMLHETYIECPACKGHMTDDDKCEQILKHREWRATNEDADAENPQIPGRMSVHISDLYANSREFPTLSIGALSVKLCTAKTDSDRKAYRRGHLALPVEKGAVQKMEAQVIRRLCGNYPRGTCPQNFAFTCLQIDVQEHGQLFKWTKLGFTMQDELFILDFGSTDLGQEIAAIMDKTMPVLDADGRPTDQSLRCAGGWIDEGDGMSTNTVLDLCLYKPVYRRLSTCKGRGGRQTENMPDRVILQNNRTHKGIPVDRYLIDEHYFKDDLYEERIAPWSEHLRKLAKGEESIAPTAPRIHFFKDAPDELLAEFTTEKKDWHVRNGKLVFGWPLKPEGGKNDYPDTVKDGLAMWYRKKILLNKKLAEAAAAKS